MSETTTPKTEVPSGDKEATWHEWYLVYQGGRHDVWCDGFEHFRTPGGYQYPDTDLSRLDLSIFRRFPCDCEYWAKRWTEAMAREN
jgi:hypothetical protein